MLLETSIPMEVFSWEILLSNALPKHSDPEGEIFGEILEKLHPGNTFITYTQTDCQKFILLCLYVPKF